MFLYLVNSGEVLGRCFHLKKIYVKIVKFLKTFKIDLQIILKKSLFFQLKNISDFLLYFYKFTNL